MIHHVFLRPKRFWTKRAFDKLFPGMQLQMVFQKCTWYKGVVVNRRVCAQVALIGSIWWALKVNCRRMDNHFFVRFKSLITDVTFQSFQGKWSIFDYLFVCGMRKLTMSVQFSLIYKRLRALFAFKWTFKTTGMSLLAVWESISISYTQDKLRIVLQYDTFWQNPRLSSSLHNQMSQR